jgi:endonuclease YncB( thermonuclease family)
MRKRTIAIPLAALLAATAIYLPLRSGHATASDKNCSDFANQAQAQSYFDSKGGSPSNNVDGLDGDGDGIACEALPCPCASPSGGGGGGKRPKGSKLPARVIAAVDGDTIQVRLLRNGKVRDVRLIGIDTPETHRPDTPIECGGPQASRSMHGLADGRSVSLRTDPTQDRIDRYGRLLAYVKRKGKNLNRIQVRRGWAKVYVYNHHPFLKLRSFKRAERHARRADRGVWRLCDGRFHTPR